MISLCTHETKKNICRFEVAMNEIGGVQIVHRAEYVIHDGCQVVLTELIKFIISKDHIQVRVLDVHDHEQVIEWIIG